MFEDVEPNGRTLYNVVDGKQRLSTVFEFTNDEFPVSDKASIEELRGLYFSSLPDENKKNLWKYQCIVEYLPETNESLLSNIFDRINRNVAKLTPQELRHAKYDGEFINVAESLSIWMQEKLPNEFPRINKKSLMQMKAVEFTSLLLLLIEEGIQSYSQNDLDQQFSERNDEWEKRQEVEDVFRFSVNFIKEVTDKCPELVSTRLRNQADFYSLVGAIKDAQEDGLELDPEEVGQKLLGFVRCVDEENCRTANENAKNYYEAARSASNDKGPRETRIKIIKKLLEES